MLKLEYKLNNYNGKKWEPYPVLREILADKKLKDLDGLYFGLTTASITIFERIKWLVEIGIFVEQNKDEILEILKTERGKELNNDILFLYENLRSFRNDIEIK